MTVLKVNPKSVLPTLNARLGMRIGRSFLDLLNIHSNRLSHQDDRLDIPWGEEILPHY